MRSRDAAKSDRSLRKHRSHLYVLVPVLDDQKHYWVGQDELEKLLRHGERWLARHPAHEENCDAVCAPPRSLAREALARLTLEEPDPEVTEAAGDAEQAVVEAPPRLNEQRVAAVLGQLKLRIPELGSVSIGERFGYELAFYPIGPQDPSLGAPTQMGVFTRV